MLPPGFRYGVFCKLPHKLTTFYEAIVECEPLVRSGFKSRGPPVVIGASNTEFPVVVGASKQYRALSQLCAEQTKSFAGGHNP